MKLTGKLFIKGQILAETGLHIGGSKSSLDIGGVDLNVIKTAKGAPFIPGSSLKGKMRSLVARTRGSVSVTRREADGAPNDEDYPYILQLFGSAAKEEKQKDKSDKDGEKKDPNMSKGEVCRLIVRDAMLNTDAFEKLEFESLDTNFTEVKWENTINRKRGVAEHPRQLERVPAGAAFTFEIVYDMYDDVEEAYLNKHGKHETAGETKLQKHLAALKLAMELLQDDYLGGQGSRGYGQVKFSGVSVRQKNVDETTHAYASPTAMHQDVQHFADLLSKL